MFPNHENRQFPSSSPCAPQDFLGVPNFMMRRSVSFSGLDRPEELHQEDEMSDDGSQILGEKKRRLNMEQVRALEKSFESGNKLEPERKTELARALGLQPRQIAIWFQNRRARWKTKQLEKDYDVLKRQFEALKANNEALKAHNNKLQDQLLALQTRESTTPINLNKDHEGSWSNGSDNSCEVNLNTPISTDSNLAYTHQTGKHAGGAVLFPPVNTAVSSLTQLLHGSSRPNHLHISQKMGGHHHSAASATNEGFCNMFGSIEENPDFWPWTDQTSFH